MQTRRVGIFGWGLVAPRSPNLEAFARNLESAESWLTPFTGFGPSNFLVGQPEFSFSDYQGWIEERFPPNRYSQLVNKMDWPTLYALGAFIQALGCNPGLEAELTRLGLEAHVYVGCGLGNIPTLYEQSLALHRAQVRWDAFWACLCRNRSLAEHLELPETERRSVEGVPAEPETVPVEDRPIAQEAWNRYWAGRSEQLARYLQELHDIEAMDVEGDPEAGKMRVMKEKRRQLARLAERWSCPDPPWAQVSANVIWNIHNTPAAQISMIGQITGPSFAPVGACSTFGLALKLGMGAIRRGEAQAVVIGATDPPPHPLVVGAFYTGRVLASDHQVSKPLSGLRGTHVGGGSVIWILGDYEHMTGLGFTPVGMEPLAVALSSDADHIITPSREGPTKAIRKALEEADVAAGEIATWDLHATATPGDFQEVATLKGVIPQPVLVTARKGTFGHGMSAGGGWELTAQYLGYERGHLYPTPLQEGELHPAIAGLHEHFVFDRPCPAPRGPAGKLSSGIGGINACVISRPW
jgi:3-oxoacyl-(acyl-carrier-protein) synthase